MAAKLQIVTALPANNVTRQELIDAVESMQPLAAFTDLTTIQVNTGKLEVAAGVLRTVKTTKTYADFAFAGLTNAITLLTLPAGAIVHKVKVKHSAAFSGGGITAYTVSVGITGNLTKYAAAFDVFQAVASTTQAVTTPSDANAPTDHLATTAVKANATSVTANLDQATTGSVDIWIVYSTAV